VKERPQGRSFCVPHLSLDRLDSILAEHVRWAIDRVATRVPDGCEQLVAGPSVAETAANPAAAPQG
jgi:hypothetical protein